MKNASKEDSDSAVPQVQGVPRERLLSVKEVSAVLGISVRKVWRMMAAGQLAAPVRMGRSSRWPQSEIQQYIEELKQQRGSRR
jgi:excisionase family DNA binding protein